MLLQKILKSSLIMIMSLNLMLMDFQIKTQSFGFNLANAQSEGDVLYTANDEAEAAIEKEQIKEVEKNEKLQEQKRAAALKTSKKVESELKDASRFAREKEKELKDALSVSNSLEDELKGASNLAEKKKNELEDAFRNYNQNGKDALSSEIVKQKEIELAAARENLKQKEIQLSDALKNSIKKENELAIARENLKQKEIPKQEIEVKKIPTIFNDVFYNNWYAEPILKCNTLNLMTGNVVNNEKVFRPLDLITRGEVIASVDKVLNYILEHTNKKIEIPNGNIEFKDLDATNWCYQSVKDLCNLKVISGYKENDLNLIKLENNLTRAEFCVIITNLVKLLNVDIESVSTKIGFEDLNSNAWYSKSITWCYNNNILSGYKEVEGHFFKPNNKIKRCEIAVAIYKLLKFFKIEGLN